MSIPAKGQREVVEFRGHPLIEGTHRATFAVTKDRHLSRRGDCIIGVAANKSCADLHEDLKKLLADHSTLVEITIAVGNLSFTAKAKGSSRLTLDHAGDIVVRKSDYVCSRTLAVKCDKAAVDIPREMIEALRSSEARGVMTIAARKLSEDVDRI